MKYRTQSFLSESSVAFASHKFTTLHSSDTAASGLLSYPGQPTATTYSPRRVASALVVRTSGSPRAEEVRIKRGPKGRAFVIIMPVRAYDAQDPEDLCIARTRCSTRNVTARRSRRALRA
jgi:hypothetical protein